MSKEFTSHLAFVTGGGSGIGLQVCQDLAAEGASVVVADIRSATASDVAASLPTGDGQVHLGIAVDVSKKSDVEAALAQVIKTYGRPADLIVNSAGVGVSTGVSNVVLFALSKNSGFVTGAGIEVSGQGVLSTL